MRSLIQIKRLHGDPSIVENDACANAISREAAKVGHANGNKRPV